MIFSTKTFTHLNREYENIMTDQLTLNKFMAVHYSSPLQEGFRLRAKFYQSPALESDQLINGGSCSLMYQEAYYQILSTLKTTGNFKAKLNFDTSKYLRNSWTNLSLEEKFSSSNFERKNEFKREFLGKLKVLYSNGEKYQVKSVFGFGSSYYLSTKVLSTILRKPDTELGLGFGFLVASLKLHSPLNHATIWYSKDDAKILLAYKLQRNHQSVLKAHLYNQLNPKTDVAIGLTRSLQDQNTFINFGFRHKHSDNLIFKTRVDSNLDFRAAFKILLSKNIQLDITSAYSLIENQDVDNQNSFVNESKIPFSIKVSFGDI